MQPLPAQSAYSGRINSDGRRHLAHTFCCEEHSAVKDHEQLMAGSEQTRMSRGKVDLLHELSPTRRCHLLQQPTLITSSVMVDFFFPVKPRLMY